MFELVSHFFWSWSTAYTVAQALINGASLATFISLAGVTWGTATLWWPVIRGLVARYTAKQLAAW
jgi:hypothetical protein